MGVVKLLVVTHQILAVMLFMNQAVVKQECQRTHQRHYQQHPHQQKSPQQHQQHPHQQKSLLQYQQHPPQQKSLLQHQQRSRQQKKPTVAAPTSVFNPPKICGVDTDECTNDINSCCSDYKCVGNQYYRSCELKQSATCLPRWADCTNNINGCCEGNVCLGDKYYKQCLKRTTTSPQTEKPTEAPTTSPPTKKPTEAPTTSPPTKNPTAAPTTFPPTKKPTVAPTTSRPTKKPTAAAPTSVFNPPTTCGVDTDECTNDINSCCSDYKCVGNQYYRSCQLKQSATCLPRWAECTNNV